MGKKIVIIVLMALFVIPLTAGKLKGVLMEDSIKVDGNVLLLNGMALRKKIIFKVYVAGMYLPKKEKSAEKILSSDTQRVVVMHFMRSVGAGKINGGWYDGLEANTPNYSKELKAKFDILAKYMEKMRKGKRIVFSYSPSKGTTVKVNGKEKGTIKGKDFADALFSCWIGKKPGPGKKFKRKLLGI